MAYIINKTNGSVLTIVNDNQLDNFSTSLVLIGKGYKDWGEKINENFVKLLENFSNNTPPPNPLNGQLWYDTNLNALKVYQSFSNSWKTLFVKDDNLNFYNQEIMSLSANVTGFINEHDIIGLFSNTEVSALLLDNGVLYPSTNAQNDFPNGIKEGLNLRINSSNIYGQNVLVLGNITPTDVNNSIVVSSNGFVKISNVLRVTTSAEFNQVKVSSSEIFNPVYYLPVSSGTLNQVLVSQGNNNSLVWKNINDVANIYDRINGHNSTSYFTAVVASSNSYNIEFYTQNNFRGFIDDDGNIGFNVVSANYLLHLEPNTSSQNSLIGIRSKDPSLDTGISIIYEVDTGNYPRISFTRTGSLNAPTETGEIIGSLIWYGQDNSNIINTVAELRTISLSADISGISGTMEVIISDGSGSANKILEITKDSEISVYYSAGSNFYTFPTSAGKTGDVLTSRGPDNKLIWEPQENYKVLLTSFPIAGTNNTPLLHLSLSADVKYEIVIKDFMVSDKCISTVVTHRELGIVTGEFRGILMISRFDGTNVYFSAKPISLDLLGGSALISADKVYNFKCFIERNPISAEMVHVFAEYYELYHSSLEIQARGYTGRGIGYDTVVTSVSFGIFTSSVNFIAGSAKYYKIENPTRNFRI